MISIWFQRIFLAAAGLSPYERFEAMRQVERGGRSGLNALLTNKWFIILGWSLIIVLLLILAAVRQHQREQNRRKQIRLFEEKANLFGLTPEERQVLLTIARQARMKQLVNIYFRPREFEAGMARFLRRALAAATNEEEKKRQIAVIESLKYKIGFVKNHSSGGGRYRRSEYLTSRQIPIDAEVGVVLNLPMDNREYRAKVVSNEVTGITLEGLAPFPLKAGDACTLQYMIGSVLWGFDVVVISCEGAALKVCHVDHARYINRRRFVRVPLHQPLWAAKFPVFVRAPKPVPPVFQQAEVVEFSGPTLRIRGALEVSRRDRILVIFEVEPGRVVQDIAEVQRVGRTGTGPFCVAEMIGMDTRSEDELIRLTNQAALEQGLAADSDEEDSWDEEQTEASAEVSV
ncbi:MAG TPA: hypothetical protein PLP49_00095 [Anaerohalosphaeraceae bacterium]|jgi:hypothetical protein|nr:hypothetical protein [Anaerohalosphaeraceae bacterium]HPB94025.1 hypothetical protein [Anaerohalosphaeraceae bacterium]HRT22455.1 hypothetical protein [Anaerohalosphaeraceae bacterium]HRU14377.1 hypothetical protein [Anaerohalosphaeraceae bacterium]